VPYISDMMGRPVTDAMGETIGALEDLIASAAGNIPHLEITALVVKRPSGVLIVPAADAVVLIPPAVPLRHDQQHLTTYQPGEHDLYLVRDVLDKQIIDTDGMRVVRVNDLEFTNVGGHFFVTNVDIGSLGLLRRLGLARSAQRIAARLGRAIPPGTISWEHVELLAGDQPLRLKVPGARLTELHPADLAQIISDLTRDESGKLLDSLDVKMLADTLEEVEPEFQASLVESMSDEKVADLLEEMGPDEAADLLAELPKDRSHELLELMEDDDAKDVRKLLAYPEDTAGGIMTTEFIAVSPNLTAEEAIAVLRATAHEAETIYYVYVADAQQRLLGVFSLKDLVLARPDTPVTEFMHLRVVSVNLRDSQDDVAQTIAKYNLLAVPVVDDDQVLHGIVTADDALDKIIPTAWKKRLPRLYG
jgi:magnesium transporter